MTAMLTGNDIEAERLDEYNDLLELLLDNGSTGAEAEQAARRIARACLEENHLWQDMNLPDRSELSRLIERNFRPLFLKNVHDMKWKKFFYKQICEREGFHLCKAPSCGACVDYAKCFGPEE